MWLDIAVHDLAFTRVQINKRVQQLISPGDHRLMRKRSGLSRDDFRQVGSFDQLHHEKCAVALSEVICDSRQPWVIQARHQPSFAFELFPKVFITRECLLERDRMAESQVYCFINCAHAAFSQVTDDSIAALQNGFRRHQKGGGQGSVLIGFGHGSSIR